MRESDREGRIMIKVIKKDGTKEEFNVQKVVVRDDMYPQRLHHC